jgi:hypothetical protein
VNGAKNKVFTGASCLHFDVAVMEHSAEYAALAAFNVFNVPETEL